MKVSRRSLLRASAIGAVSALLTAAVMLTVPPRTRPRAEERQKPEAVTPAPSPPPGAAARKIDELFESGDVPAALTHLAKALRQNPADRVAAERLVSALTYRSFVIPLAAPLVHSSPITWARFSPDGSRLVLVSGQIAFIANAGAGPTSVQQLKHAGEIHSAEFSPDNRWMVTASSDGAARLWDVTTGKAAVNALRHEKGVWFAEFSPDGKRVATCSEDRTARLWEAGTGKPLPLALPHPDGVRGARFSPEGARLMTSCADGRARIWDLRSGKVLALFTHKADAWAARFSPDGRRLATAADPSVVTLRDARDGSRLLGTPEREARVHSVEFSSDGRQLLVAYADKVVMLYDAMNGGVTQTLGSKLEEFTGAVFSPGTALLTWSDKTTRLWDIRPGDALAQTFWLEDRMHCVAFSPDGRLMAAAAVDGRGRVWDARRGEVRAELRGHRTNVNRIAFSPDSQWLLTSSDDGTARIWDAATGRLLQRLQHAHRVRTAEFSPDGRLVLTSSLDKTARLWDARSGQPHAATLEHAGAVWAARFSPDGQHIVTASQDKTARLWKTADAAPATAPLAHTSVVYYAAFSPNGHRVVSTTEDGSVHIWDSGTGQRLKTFWGHQSRVAHAEFSPDGRRVVTASADGTARVWDLEPARPPVSRSGSGALPAPLILRHSNRIGEAHFAPDGLRILTCSDDGTIRLWNALDGQPLSEPLPHGGPVYQARFSPDGRSVATASADKAARVWDTAPAPLPAPAWLPQLAEAIAGQRFDASHRAVSSNPLWELKAQLGRDPVTEFFSQWGRWFFAERATRALAPFSEVTVPTFVQQCLRENTAESLRAALRLSPESGPAMTRLAQQLLHHAAAQGESGKARGRAEADGLSLRAVTLFPKDAEAWLTRAEVLDELKDRSGALEAVTKATELSPGSAESWYRKGVLLERMDRLDDATPSYTKAIELEVAETDPAKPARQKYLRQRSHLFRRLGRTNEAIADNLAAYDIPRRDASAPPELVDLSLHFNENLKVAARNTRSSGVNFEDFPQGLQDLAGTRFDVRGIVKLVPAISAADPRTSEKAIAVHRKCRQLHFLHAARRPQANQALPDGTPIGSYVLHYAGGLDQKVPIVYGQDVRAWISRSERSRDLPRGQLAWSAPPGEGPRVQLFKTTVETQPGRLLESVDFLCTSTNAAPMLLAMTTED